MRGAGAAAGWASSRAASASACCWRVRWRCGAPVLLLDEPTTHLDAPHQRALLRSLAARARDGAAVLAVLHDVTLALAADRVLVMDRGRLVADGAPADAALRAALVAVFEGAFSVECVSAAPCPRWVALPKL